MVEKDLTKLFSDNEFQIQGSHNHGHRNKVVGESEGKLVVIVDVHYHTHNNSSVKPGFEDLKIQDLKSLKIGILKKGPTGDRYTLVNPYTGTEEQFFYQDLIALFVPDYKEDSEE